MAFWIVAVEASPWGFGWEALVAIGTLLLAVATGGLAWSTRNLASKTAEEVEHSKGQVAASLAQVDVAQQQAATAQAALDASQEQARLAQLTLNAQIRPVLVDMPPKRLVGQGKVEVILYPGRESQGTPGVLEAFVDNTGAMISVPMRNAGTGLAMIRGISLEVGEESPPAPVTIQPANVPPGERLVSTSQRHPTIRHSRA